MYQQIGLGMTSMLTLIAYMLTLGGTLPRIAYLTRADRFFVGSAVLVFLGLVKAVAAISLAQRPARARPRADEPMGPLGSSRLACSRTSRSRSSCDVSP